MYARVTTGYAQPGKLDELEQYTRETLVPLYPQQQGCKGALFLTDRSANKVMAITLWETEADMAAGEASEGYYREQHARMARLFASAPVREAYEVKAQQMQRGKTPLYARVITFHLQSGKLDMWTQITRDAVGPVAREQQGYKGVLSLIDKSANKIMAISLWETEADMKAGESNGYVQEQFAQVAPALTAAPVVEAYEVTAQV